MDFRHQSASALLASLAVLASGCAQSPLAIDSILRVELPLSAAGVTYGEVEATQGSARIRAELGATNSVVHLRVRPGEPTRISATLFEVATDSAWRTYEGAALVVPKPGPNSVDVVLTRAPEREGTFVPAFVDSQGSSFELMDPGFSFGVRDEATGFVQDNVFHARAGFSLPFGRLMTITAKHPADGQLLELGLAPLDALGALRVFGLGAPPASPKVDKVVPAGGDALDVLSLLPSERFGLELQCAEGTCASASSWQKTCGSFSIDKSADGPYEIAVRYELVPTLCEVVRVARDTRRPQVLLRLSPTFLTGSDSGTSPPVDVTLQSDEPLDLTGINVTATGSTSWSCAPVSELLPDQYGCTVALAGWSAGPVSVLAQGADRAGNPFSVTRVLPAVSSGSTAATGVRTIPAEPDPAVGRFWVGVELALADTSVCKLELSKVDFFAPDGTAAPAGSFTLSPDLPATQDFLSGSVDPAKHLTADLWMRVGVDPTAVGPGDYTATAEVLVFTGACQAGPTVTAQTIGPVPLPLRATKMSPLTSEPLVISSLTGRAPAMTFDPLAAFGFTADAALGNNVTLSADDPTLVQAVSGESYALSGVKPGTTRARLSAPDGRRAIVDVIVEPSPEILALQWGQVVRRTAAGDVLAPFDPRLGAPLRVLWEPSGDRMLALGENGLQVLAPSTEPALIEPCGAKQILVDAALKGSDDPARAALALLVRASDGSVSHCEVELGTSLAWSVPLPVGSGCERPSRIASDPVTGSYAVFGAGCAASYLADAGTLTLLAVKGAAVLDGPPLAAAYDPFGAYAAIVAPVGPNPASLGGWGIATSLQGSELFDTRPPVPLLFSAVTAATVDPLSGHPIAVVATIENVNDYRHHLERFDDRFVARPPFRSVGLARSPDELWERVTLDASSRLLYVTSGSAPAALWIFDVDALSAAPSASGWGPWPGGAEVFDLAIAGPQPLWLSTASAGPGDVVVLQGLGFAGAGADEVFVQGIAADVLGSTPTSVTFRVPSAFARLSDPIYTSWVTVRAHGRLSGPVGAPLIIQPRAVSLRLSSPTGGSNYCLAACTEPVLVATAGANYLVRPNDINQAGVMSLDAGTIVGKIGPVAPTPLGGGRRLVGTRSGVWIDTSLPQASNAPEQSQRFSNMLLQGKEQALHLAADPTGRLLALDVGNGETGKSQIRLYWATTLTPVSAPALATALSTIEAMTFTAGGETLFAAASSDAIAAFDLAPSTVPAVVTTDPLCPSAPAIALWPGHGLGDALGLFYDGLAQSVVVADIEKTTGGYHVSCPAGRAPSLAGKPLASALSPDSGALAVLGPIVVTDASVQLLDTEQLLPELDRNTKLGDVSALLYMPWGGALRVAGTMQFYDIPLVRVP